MDNFVSNNLYWSYSDDFMGVLYDLQYSTKIVETRQSIIIMLTPNCTILISNNGCYFLFARM